MKANKAELQGLITLLNRIYGEIRSLEEQWDIRVDAQDFRPRIEYFHDAIRALTSGADRTGRLSVEFLAYDIGMLRHIQANPTAKAKGTKTSLSPGTALTVYDDANQSSAKPSSSVRTQLADLYKSYSVLFAALLTDTADRNYYDRISECNNEVENLAVLEQALKAQKKDANVAVDALVDEHIDDPDLARKILTGTGSKKKITASEALRKCKEIMEKADKEIKTIEQAHFTYATSRLAVYENSRDVVKKMAQEGMNIVGNFVENAVREANRGGSRGI